MPATQPVTDNTTDVLQLFRDDRGGLYADIQVTTTGTNILSAGVHVIRIPVLQVMS